MWSGFVRYYQELFINPLFYDKQEWKIPVNLVINKNSFSLRKVRDGKYSILIVPPTAGHHPNICEPLVKYYLENTDYGIYIFDCHSPTPYSDIADLSIEDLVNHFKECLLYIDGRFHVIGLCQGGWLSTIVACLYPFLFQTLTLVNSPIDTHADKNNLIYQYVQSIPMEFYEWMVKISGNIQSGWNQLIGFYCLSWNELMFKRYGDLFGYVLNGEDAKIEKWHRNKSWYDQPQNISGKWYLEAVKWLFKENRLVRGELIINNRNVKLNDIECSLILMSGEDDHITTTPQLFAMEELVDVSVTKYIVPNTGHIATFMPQKTMKEWEKIISIQHFYDIIYNGR